ncbi:MAG TPA: D-TA family PLP-dependent enzyme [Ohtaekwangia sp.]|nr:D-TA family PLP-dependent enzyme [Ohtaekwangia sp.]
MDNPWYTLNNTDGTDTPALVVYPDRAQENIHRLVNSIDRTERLRPHVKTHKSAEISRMMLNAGIKKFKCATIAEAEMLATAGAADILLAYQPVGPKAIRLAGLMQKFPSALFSCLVDHPDAAIHLDHIFEKANNVISVYIDLNVGMNRTGIIPTDALSLYEKCLSLKNVKVVGLHAYDGHLRDEDFDVRTTKCNAAFEPVQALHQAIAQKFNTDLKIVAGGTPTFSIHCKRKDVECSPGTFIYWDKGYEQILKEQHYLHAAVVMTRVISKPADDIICVDLGHKSIASENPLANRIIFVNAPDLQPKGHSEEHMTFQTSAGNHYKVGDVLYGVPFHVCPTIALYDESIVVKEHEVTGRWSNVSRMRRITV